MLKVERKRVKKKQVKFLNLAAVTQMVAKRDTAQAAQDRDPRFRGSKKNAIAEAN
ncbi:hypothetical protein O9992_09840 [Vibrio lentus]|nr:hypothetical protein [Vibrio lentus]